MLEHLANESLSLHLHERLASERGMNFEFLRNYYRCEEFSCRLSLPADCAYACMGIYIYS